MPDVRAAARALGRQLLMLDLPATLRADGWYVSLHLEPADALTLADALGQLQTPRTRLLAAADGSTAVEPSRRELP